MLSNHFFPDDLIKMEIAKNSQCHLALKNVVQSVQHACTYIILCLIKLFYLTLLSYLNMIKAKGIALH